MNARTDSKYFCGLILGALGVVYGDIGTSPLYALRECFHGAHAVPASPSNIIGVLSLIFWSLIVIVSIKYLTFILRADNKGEGGILALLSLTFPDRKGGKGKKNPAFLITLGVFGAALLYGDGMITPAVSVLSAVEGLEVATPYLKPYVVPTTVVILIALFSLQKRGTCKVGQIFGPVMVLWFIVIAVLGLKEVLTTPSVVASINPFHGVRFLQTQGWSGFVVLGAVFLVVTGGEALYADMGHFGRKPIRWAWFGMVLPSLFLNYLGQGALLLRNPSLAENPFYFLAPKWALYPLVVLATCAAVIASQALISGAFSLTMQAIQLGYFPRLAIEHTSSDEKGQIYIPHVNWALMLACIGLVIGFGSSSNLAAAYGIAVTLTMIITTALFYYAARDLWGWHPWIVGLECACFLVLELAFFGANCVKIAHGGWFPLVTGALIYTLMSTWKTGRQILSQRLRASSLPCQDFLEDVKHSKPTRVSGTAVFMAGNSEGTPLALLHNVKHNKVLHQRVILLTISIHDEPHVDAEARVTIEKLKEGFFRVVGHYGFMDEPSIPEVLQCCAAEGLEIRPHDTTFFLSRETIIPSSKPGMAIWRERLFAVMARNAQPATAFFRLPANRVVELGMQVEI